MPTGGWPRAGSLVCAELWRELRLEGTSGVIPIEETWQQESQKVASWESGSSQQEESGGGQSGEFRSGSTGKLRQRPPPRVVGQRTQLSSQSGRQL